MVVIFSDTTDCLYSYWTDFQPMPNSELLVHQFRIVYFELGLLIALDLS